MTAPQRLRRSRARGATLPPGTIIVDRSTPWGNPFIVGKDGDAAYCVRLFELMLCGSLAMLCTPTIEEQKARRRYILDHIKDLRGRDLAFWCRLDKPCHADSLILMANRPLKCEASDG